MVEKEEKGGIDVLHGFLESHKNRKSAPGKKAGKKERVRYETPPEGRISSGILNFDDLIEGGIKEGSTSLVMGGPGTGKTIFSIQFLMEAINEEGGAVYLSFEEEKEEVYEDMKQFGWDLSKYEDEKKFHYMHYTPEQIQGLMAEGGGTLDSFMRKVKPKRIVIDSVTAFTLLGSDELKKRENLLALLDLIDKWNCTTIFTSQHTPVGKFEHEVASFIEYEVDCIVLLYYVRKGMLGAGRERKLEVLKMRGTAHETGAVNFTIDENGIVIG